MTRILVTGANGGIGFETCAVLVEEGVDSLVAACRTMDKAQSVRGHLGSVVEPAGGFDMLDRGAIEGAVAALPDRPFDAVFLQAGGWVFTETFQTVDWFGQPVEKTIAKNVLGAHVTLMALAERGLLAAGCRVVIIGGEGARGIPGMIPRPEFDADSFRVYLRGEDPRPYDPLAALGASKFSAALWSQRMAAEHPELDVVWFSPGLTGGTAGTAGMPAWKEWMFQNIGFPLMVLLGRAQWPRTAGRKCAEAVLGRIGYSGDVLGAPQGTAFGEITDQKPMNPGLTDPALAEVLWNVIDLSGSEDAVRPAM